MSRFIFFTKTYWDEPPRLRHQFAELVASAGHEVLFFEKPSSTGATKGEPRPRTELITSLQHRELMHHKLRLTPALQRANAAFTVRAIARRLRPFPPQPSDVVISFNYDYWFLRRLFPRNRLITVINDDFICVALFGYTKPLLWALQRTCEISDRVLTVSVPLQKQLAPYAPAELFLPWADGPYRAPERAQRRNILLFWGYLNRRIDFAAVHALADRLWQTRPEMRLHFVGPVYPGSESDAEALKAKPNIEVLPPTPLDDLPLQHVLASIIPYRPFDLEVDAITLSNKGLRLLSRGLPLLISPLPALPNFLKAPFVLRLDALAPEAQLDTLAANFDGLQGEMAAFVDQHGPEARLQQLLGTAEVAPAKAGFG